MPKSCYATSLLEKGQTCPEHDLNGKGQYCKCRLTNKVPNPETCGKSFEWERNNQKINKGVT
jgi:hypothetical protein